MAEALLIPYSLSIRITTDGFSFTLEQNQETILKRRVYCPDTMLPEKLLEEFQQQNLLGKQFEHTKITLHSKSQAVPDELYRKEDEAVWFTSLHPTKRIQDIVLTSQYIPEFGCHNIFAIPKTLHDTLHNALGDNIIYQHVTSELIQALLNQKNKCMAIYQQQNGIDMVVVENGTLVLTNHFPTQTETDIAYWVLNAMEQLKLPTSLNSVLILPENTPALNNLLQKLLS
ncbi:MAG: DUF3822 family protein [Paludibacteraceae bacterium]|nr:DUF3822 family protein [Paludibacteraceae bacterium]